MKTKLTLLLLCFCSSVFSESYVVTSYAKEGESDSYSFKRVDNVSFRCLDELGPGPLLNILYESGNLLILGASYDPVEDLEQLKEEVEAVRARGLKDKEIEKVRVRMIKEFKGEEGMRIHYIDKKLKKYYPVDLSRRRMMLLGKGSPDKVQDLSLIHI